MKPPAAAVVVLLAAACLGGCHARTSLDGTTAATSRVPAEGPTRGRPTLGSPIQIGNSSTTLTPFAFGQPRTLADKLRLPSWLDFRQLFLGPTVPRAGNDYAGPGPRDVLWQNAIFTDPLTGRADALLDFRGVVTQALLVDRNLAPRLREGVWAFTVVGGDSNGDGFLDGEDTGAILLTSPEGDWVRLATAGVDTPGVPGADTGGQRLVSISAQPGTELLLLRVLRDADGDGRFTAEDPIEPWAVDPTVGAGARRLIPLGFVGRLEALAR